MRALIIEDEPMVAWSLGDLLESLGFDAIDQVTTEAEAIAAATSNCPNLIVADSILPKGSGVAAVRTICADREIPTVFVTGDRHSVASQIPDALILDKPHTTRQLVTAVRSLLSFPMKT